MPISVTILKQKYVEFIAIIVIGIIARYLIESIVRWRQWWSSSVKSRDLRLASKEVNTMHNESCILFCFYFIISQHKRNIQSICLSSPSPVIEPMLVSASLGITWHHSASQHCCAQRQTVANAQNRAFSPFGLTFARFCPFWSIDYNYNYNYYLIINYNLIKSPTLPLYYK